MRGEHELGGCRVRVTRAQLDALQGELGAEAQALGYGRPRSIPCSLWGHPLEIVDDLGVEVNEVHRWSEDMARDYSRRIAELRERQVRHACEQKLRPRLRWLVNHPHLLRWVYRLAPSWRPSTNVSVASTVGSDR